MSSVPLTASHESAASTATQQPTGTIDWYAVLHEFYEKNCPSRIKTIPTWLEKHKGKEEIGFRALRGKYRKEKERSSLSVTSTTSQASSFRKGSNPERQRITFISNPTIIPPTPVTTEPKDMWAAALDASREGSLSHGIPSFPNTQAADHLHSDFEAMDAPVTPVSIQAMQVAEEMPCPPQSSIEELIFRHLKMMGLHEASRTFSKEVGMVPDGDPFLELNGMRPFSPLQILFARKTSTNSVIEQLLVDTPTKLTASAHHFFDRETMGHLVQMALEPMWSHSRKVYTKDGRQRSQDIAQCGPLRAATLNQLIERITKVINQPHVTPLPEHKEREDVYLESFLRTYKHFCSPHTLLAKLFQRWFVPFGLPLTDDYANYYIMVSTKASKSSAKYWDVVSNKVKYRVAAVLLEWITQFPDDWDDVMVNGLEVFMDDNFYEPTPDSPVVHTQLLQWVCVLKTALRNLIDSRSETQEETFGLDAPAADDEEPLTFASEALSEEELANQICALDHEEVRRINVRELLDFTKNEMHFLNLQAHVQGTFQSNLSAGDDEKHPVSPMTARDGTDTIAVSERGDTERVGRQPIQSVATKAWASNLSSFFQRTEDYQRWILVELLTTSAESERVYKMEKFINIAYRLLERRNFQACQATVFALHHPAIQRMKRFLSRVSSIQSLKHLAEYFSSCDPHNTKYKLLLNSVMEADLRDLEQNPPIPCLGVWVNDLHLVEETEPTVLIEGDDSFIHWRKFQVISSIYTCFASMQSFTIPPHFSKKTSVQRYLATTRQRCKHFDYSTLMKLSYVREPPSAQTERFDFAPVPSRIR